MDNISLDQALKIQVGGDHYKKLPYQPIVFISKLGLNFIQGSIVKYVCRAPFHPKTEECYDKVLHYCDFGINLDVYRGFSESQVQFFASECQRFCVENDLDSKYSLLFYSVCIKDYELVKTLVKDVRSLH